MRARTPALRITILCCWMLRTMGLCSKPCRVVLVGLVKSTRQAALERQDLSCTCLAHREIGKLFTIIMILFLFIALCTGCACHLQLIYARIYI